MLSIYEVIMAAKKQQKNVKEKDAAAAKASAANKTAPTVGRTPPAEREKVAATDSAKAQNSAKPTARTCPLVLDGEIEAADFSPGMCLSCDEFDCRFCEAATGSGPLRSRLFAAPDEEEYDDDWDDDSDAGFWDEDDDSDSDADIDEENIF
jgi:hypothetical protein